MTVSQDPTEHRFVQNPYRFYAERHATDPTFFWEEYDHWCLASFDAVNALFKNRSFGLRPGLPVRKPAIDNWYETERFSLLALDPPEHTQMRGLVNRAFLSRRVEQLRPKIESLAHELIDGFIDRGTVDLQVEFAAPLPAIVIAELIGLPRAMAPQLLRWSNEMVKMYMYGVDAAVEAAADTAAAEFSDYLKGVIADRRRTPTDDLLTHMLQTEVDGQQLCDAEVIATTILLLNAGHEATVHTTGNAVAAICASDFAPTELFATPQSTTATVEECLRFDAPLHMFTRFALEDVEFGGKKFQVGDEIGLLLGAANHDPQRFESPDRFDPFRDDAGNVAFGAGIHFCIGAPLARIELQSSLRILFERIPTLAPVAEKNYRNIYHFHGLDELQVEWSR